MKLTIPRDQLITGLSRVIDCAHTNVSSPVLCAVLLEAGSGLTLSTTKLDLSANTSIAADVAKPGSIALPAKRLMQVVKELPEGPVSIEAKGGRATIKGGSATFQMAGFDKSAFPARGTVSENNKLEATAPAIANMLASLAYAADMASGQMTTFNGVNLSVKGGKLSMQATDKKRIAVNSKTVDAAHDASCIIPNGSVAVFSRLLGEALSVSIAFDDSGIYLSLTHEGGTTNIQSAIISSKYPDVQAVIDRQLDAPYVEIPVSKDAFTTLLRRVAIATDELTPFCRFHFEPKKLTVYAVTKSFGEAEESMDIAYDGPVVDIGLKPKDLLDPIGVCGETVKLSICNGAKPAVIRGDDHGFLCLVAPIPLT
jgi:DNA polymerase-3 subunit beta